MEESTMFLFQGGELYEQSDSWSKVYIDGFEDVLESLRHNSHEYSEEEIHELCNTFGFDCYINLEGVNVTTNCGVWKIYMDEDGVTDVYHKNYKNGNSFSKLNKYRGDVYQRYHRQDIEMTDLYDVLLYIKEHDENLLYKKSLNPVDFVLQKGRSKHYIKLQ